MPYRRPEGNTITVGSELSRRPDVRFLTRLHRKRGQRHPNTTFEPIMKCDVAPERPLRQQCALWQHHSVYGRRRVHEQGSHGTRITDLKMKVVAASEWMYSGWIGASIRSSLSTFHRMGISKSRMTSQARRQSTGSSRRDPQGRQHVLGGGWRSGVTG